MMKLIKSKSLIWPSQIYCKEKILRTDPRLNLEVGMDLVHSLVAMAS